MTQPSWDSMAATSNFHGLPKPTRWTACCTYRRTRMARLNAAGLTMLNTSVSTYTVP